MYVITSHKHAYRQRINDLYLRQFEYASFIFYVNLVPFWSKYVTFFLSMLKSQEYISCNWKLFIFICEHRFLKQWILEQGRDCLMLL